MPARRSDARRNRDRLLRVARDVFDDRGVDAPLDGIARRAGVGNATMYRHFPTRRDLLVAAYADEVNELCAHGEALLEARSPADALFDWLRAFVGHVATKRDLALAIPGERSALFDDWHAAMRSTTSALLARAQGAGAVRAGVTVAELHALANGIALTAADAQQADRLLRLVRDGIVS